VALVTGASRGIGRAVALELADAGMRVALASTSLEGTRELLEALKGQGREACAVAMNVGDPSSVTQGLGQIERTLGPVDVLVNNAGIVRRKPLEQMADADFDEVVRVNLSGPFYLARRLVPGMVARGVGRVVNVSSISGTLGTPRMSGYCASKWGLNGLTKALAEELKGSGVFVAALLPGSVDTDMLKGSGFAPQMTAVEVARMVRFLCVEAPMAMTGSLVEMFG
jgi:3-oxoacyl-[acyl-carrier protein] reductase